MCLRKWNDWILNLVSILPQFDKNKKNYPNCLN